jgi:hypothetical protein
MSRSTNPPDSATRLPSKESRDFYRPAHGQRINHPGVSPGSPVNKQQVQILVEQLPVKLRERQALPAALAENAQYHCGFLHYASLMVPSRSSPVPLRPVDRH